MTGDWNCTMAPSKYPRSGFVRCISTGWPAPRETGLGQCARVFTDNDTVCMTSNGRLGKASRSARRASPMLFLKDQNEYRRDHVSIAQPAFGSLPRAGSAALCRGHAAHAPAPMVAAGIPRADSVAGAEA